MTILKFTEENFSEKHSKFLDENFAPLTQYGFYADWQNEIGRKQYVFTVTDQDNNIKLFMQSFIVAIGFGKNFLHSPYGPVLDKKIINSEELKTVLVVLIEGLRSISAKFNCSFTRLDFVPNIDQILQKVGNLGLIQASKRSKDGSFFQPRVEWALDLTKDPEQIYREIDSKNRYAIRLAERKNVQVEIIKENISEYFDIFYKMMTDTAERNSFSLHKREYYTGVFESLKKNNNGRLVLTKIDNQIATCLVFVDYNQTTMFLFGASSTLLNKIVPTSHFAHWKNIQYSKSSGFKIYNFGGVENDKYQSESLRSLTTFKKRFGGYEIEHSGFYDLVVDKFIYKIFLFKKLIRFFKNLI